MNIYVKMVCEEGKDWGVFVLVRENRLMWKYIGFTTAKMGSAFYISPDFYHSLPILVITVKEEEERRIGQSNYLEFKEGDLDGYSS